jgi:hypothetical protein
MAHIPGQRVVSPDTAHIRNYEAYLEVTAWVQVCLRSERRMPRSTSPKESLRGCFTLSGGCGETAGWRGRGEARDSRQALSGLEEKEEEPAGRQRSQGESGDLYHPVERRRELGRQRFHGSESRVAGRQTGEPPPPVTRVVCARRLFRDHHVHTLHGTRESVKRILSRCSSVVFVETTDTRILTRVISIW